jgi:predicted ribosome quality control (RQC) complex YloA/Tae2 family protein
MRVKLDITKSLEKNAETYFEKSKKAKKKLEGAGEALKRSLDKLEKAKKEKITEEKQEKKVQRKKKRRDEEERDEGKNREKEKGRKKSRELC